MLQMKHHTSRLLLAAVLLAAFAFSSCERDKYLDWKYINQSWYEQHKNDAKYVEYNKLFAEREKALSSTDKKGKKKKISSENLLH